MGMEPDRDAGIGRISLGKQTFRSFMHLVFRLYFGAMLGQMMAMNMQMLARSLLLRRLTSSPLIVGAMSFAHAIPTITLSLFGGVIADRVQKKNVMLAGQAGSAVVALGVALPLTLGYLSPERAGSWWILVVASVDQGTIMALMIPSRQAILPEIVGEEELMNTISLNMLGMNSLRLFAPTLAGFLIDVIGFASIYYGMIGMYLMAVAFIAFIPPTSSMAIRGGGALASTKEGINYLRHETTILFILGFTLIVVTLSMPYIMLLPFFCDDILKVGATGVGMLMIVSGIGAIISSVVLASPPNKKRGVMLLTCSAILGVGLVGFAFSSSWYLPLGLMAIVGLVSTGRMTLGNTLIQYYVDDEYRGRMMSIYIMEFGLTSFGTFAAGALAQAVGVQRAVGRFAMVLVFLAVLALAFVPQLRRLD